MERTQLSVVPMGEGAVIGAYRLLQQIGAGGMGAVWLAEHTKLGRRAAIKVLHPMYSSREDIVTRFFNEARAATAISDPGIVQIFDFGHHTDGSAYIVMELLDGETLDKRHQRLGRLAVGDALRILRQVASSLGAAHARGIVHRDLKPENIFLVRDPEVPGGERAKILDFGIAKLAGDQVGVKTQTSAMMGTPLFMSPEQCRGAGGVDQRSDVYALGCVLLTIVTGRPPFDAAGMGEIIAMHMLEPAPRASSRVPDMPRAVDDLIAQCLEKDPARRFTSGTELAAAIGGLMGQRFPTPVPFAAPTGGAHVVGVATTLSGSASSISAASMPTAPRRRRSVVIASASVVALAVAGGGMWAATRGASSEPQTTAPAPGSSVAPTEPVAAVAAVGSAVAPAPSPPPAATPPPVVHDDKPDRAKAQLRQALIAFTRWAPSHPGAPCPTASELGWVLDGTRAIDDPWGHPVAITCTDQPEGQRIGVISAGPDGAFTTDDDLRSWTLDEEATRAVQGPRWAAATVPASKTHKSTSHGSKPPVRTTTTVPRSTTTPPGSATTAATTPAISKPAEPPPTTAQPTPPASTAPTPTPTPPTTVNGGIPRHR